MPDFLKINTKVDDKKKSITVYPNYSCKKSKDLMIKGKTFYAIWDERLGLWSLNEDDVIEIIDSAMRDKVEELKEKKPDYTIKAMYLDDYNTKRLKDWQMYCNTIQDNYKELDSRITFLNDDIRKEDYISKRLPYAIEDIPTPNWDELVSTLYSDEERQKIEWAIGSIIAGDSKDIQKFYVFYGAPGSGKSTILKIIGKLFEGYTTTFDAKAIGNPNATFALEPFKDNPLIAIQDDGDLSRVEDNTRLNSIASHERLIINEKHKSTYSARFNTVMFMGTNKPVRITDAKSGIMRRLIDINPSGKLLPPRKYDAVMEQIEFELGGIAYHCYELYKSLGKKYYDRYRPINMIGITNDFFNFVDDNLEFFIEHKDGVQLKRVWQVYKDYVQDSNTQYPFTLKAFKEELKSYFDEYYQRNGGERNVYKGFKMDKFSYVFRKDEEEDEIPSPFVFDETESLIDKLYSDMPAQYANDDGKPTKKWDDVSTKLSDLDTHKLHYVLMPEEHIVIDFDLKNEKGEKDFERNLEAASKFPPTYAELSKSGAGIHLHYIYTGDPKELSRIYAEDIEVKVFTGKSSLRRCLTKCNNLPIAKISSGLPLKKGDKSMINFEAMKNEKQLRALIKNCLDKKHHGATKPEVDYIYDSLEKAYESGMKYDVTDMRPDITAFANNSTNQALACLKLVSKMKFKSEEPSGSQDNEEAPIIFFDCEVFPNLFIICWKYQGAGKKVVKMINPSPSDVEKLFKFRMIGFNCRRYDNHIIYARSIGYSNEELFTLSTRIVNSEKRDENRNCFFGEAYNLSYTDVYDYAATKQSLKKWEIELGIHHVENEYPWDQPVEESHWEEIADYCCNDVIATEKVHEHLEADFKARLILAKLSGLTPNDTTNNHTTRLIVGNDRNPQDKFVYTDLSKTFPGYRFDEHGIPKEEYKDEKQIVNGKSIFMGEDPSEGGYVYAEPGMYTMIALMDVESEHPTSAIEENVFGPYTENFAQLKQVRISIKHKEYDKVKEMFDGKLAPFIQSDEDADALSYALKIAINSVYGLTSAKFPNKLRDPRNIDNIVAKRGALFMIALKHEVQKRGFTVAHIKTDSIKIPNATPEIISFVTEFGKKYGYTFEHEATYEKMCLVNDAVYVAKYASEETCKKMYGYLPSKQKAGKWTATGTEFQVPFVFKALFSHEPVEFKDYCETKAVSKGSLYLDMNENLPEDEHNYKFIGKVGEFCPIAPGKGGGILYRVADDKYYAAAGTKGYRWLDSETVKNLKWEDRIDDEYFRKLVDDSIEHISEFGDFEWFVSDDPVPPVIDPCYIPDGIPEEVPFDEDFPAMNKPVA